MRRASRLYREFAPDFFDLDHRGRGSPWQRARRLELARDSRILHRRRATGHDGDTLRQDNRDTYDYFGDPVYTYSLRQGIQDGFLAPYQVRRVVIGCGRRGLPTLSPASSTTSDARFPTRSTPRATSSATSRSWRAPRPWPHHLTGVPQGNRSLRQDHRLLRRSGTRRARCVRRSPTPTPTSCASIPITSFASRPTRVISAGRCSPSFRTWRRRSQSF